MTLLETINKIKSLPEFEGNEVLSKLVSLLESNSLIEADELTENHSRDFNGNLKFIPDAVTELVVNFQSKYDILADYLSDHLWQRNSLDYEFLKTFPEFIYKGEGYRVHFLESEQESGECLHKSFAKTLQGIKEYIYNAQTYDKDFVANRKPFIYKGEVEGFDVQAALTYFKKTKGLTPQTINSFLGEEEVIAFSHSSLVLIKL